MRRTQLYLDDELWDALHARARQEGTTISELMRQAARERYLGQLDARRAAMEAFVGIRRDHPELRDVGHYLRRLRRGRRVERL